MAEPFSTMGIFEMQMRQGIEAVDPTIDIPDNSGVYGFNPKRFARPETLAPSEDEVGGFLFLPGGVSNEVLTSLVALAGLDSKEHFRCDQYAVQVIDAPEGMEKSLGYMRKLVVADKYAMRFLFRAINEVEYAEFGRQPMDVSELIQAFVDDERSKYGTMFGNPRLAGKFGGDGHFAQESLGFGFSIENGYHKVVSIWSRGWLCTK